MKKQTNEQFTIQRLKGAALKSAINLLLVSFATFGLSCSSTQSFFGLKTESDVLPPISNPFPENRSSQENTRVRSRVGDQFTELELPKSEGHIDSYTFPHQSLDGSPVSEESDLKQGPTVSDYEILSKVRRVNTEDEGNRREIERDLGVRTLESEVPNQKRSILVQIDAIKQLYRGQRYETALVRVDTLLTEVPTLPLLYQMRGTLLERLGHKDLALQSWKHALKLEPENLRLKKLVDRREKQRGLASGENK